ncbi:spondin-1 [Cimex lectularius]|uniref:Spondin-1 n=1 Tax=Cimex lectularius TaxID=79782 RepID=A0A8I6RLW5_CIMLE|nr:spondin-1 [Cimex lectularius]
MDMLKFAVVLALVLVGASSDEDCDRRPPGAIGSKSRFYDNYNIMIIRNPSNYSPGEMYTVKLAGLPGDNGEPAKFIGFSLSVITMSRSGREPGSLVPLGDAKTERKPGCKNIIISTEDSPKSEISVFWTAPAKGTGCVVFKAAVVVEADLWYQDEGSLIKQICENHQQSIDEMPDVTPVCCACDEAKYEVSFEGLWSRHTHPKDFPENVLTRFSDVIGASHTFDYRFWQYGGKASEGLRQVAELGSTRVLESELKSESENIRTIIKARGITYPNVTSKTFAVFRVDNKNHLISLVSMIDPSPDWVVGVSGLELCLSNCSWVENKVLNLYPYDVGTDSGITYTSPDQPTEPRDNIRRITTTFPSDPRSPFYDPSGKEMKPLARLYLTRQRLYEKSCDQNGGEMAELNYPVDPCAVNAWSDWSPCSATCGTGKRSRQRFYRDESMATMENCNRELTYREHCEAPIPCGELMGREREDYSATLCEVTEWSDWSGCSVSCGEGTRYRFRRIKNQKNYKKCTAYFNHPPLRQEEKCVVKSQDCKDLPMNLPFTDKCVPGPWSEWSACSVNCGMGTRRRHREIISRTWGGGPDQCSHILQNETITCSEKAGCELTAEQAREACQSPKMPGPCRGQFEKWYFDTSTRNCMKFVYSGCWGNRNQFDTQEECEKTCKKLKGDRSLNGPFSGFDAESQVKVWDYVPGGAEGPVVDCKVSHWSAWSACSVSCGRGLRQKTRQIIMNARNGGKDCPKKLLRRKRCNAGPCTTGYMSDENKAYDEYEDSEEDCRYSEWSEWSPCTQPCEFSIQKRVKLAISDKERCGKRLQTRICNCVGKD